jgi:uncharacterized alpha-E superfamily protein
MLSRVANSLYWAGRYVERCDHTASFINIHYFASLDTPNKLAQEDEFVLESLLFIAGHEYDGPLSEKEVLHHVGYDKENPLSIINTAIQARVNAHGTRHLISTECWEAFNKFYHLVNNYDPEVFVTTGLYDLSIKLNEACSMIREKIIRTLMHDEVWALLMVGIHLERAFQIIRLLNTKLYDVDKIQEKSPELNDLSYEWATLLRCAEVYDMSKKFYRKTPNQSQAIEFLILNTKNPKSLISNIDKLNSYIQRISDKDALLPGSIEFIIGKFHSYLTYMTMEEIDEDTTNFVLHVFDELNTIGAAFEKDYLFLE